MPLPERKNSALYSNSFLIFIVRFFPSLAGLLVVVFYSRQLPLEQYGSYANFWVHLNVLYPLACFGIHAFIIAYSPGFLVHLLKSINLGSILLYSSWVIGLAVAFAFLEHQKLGIHFVVPFVFFLLYSISVILESFLIVFRKFRLLIVTNVIYFFLFCAIHQAVLQKGGSIPSVFFLLLPVVLFRFVVYLIGVIRSLKVTEPTSEGGVATGRQLRSLWLHLGIYDVSQSLFTYIDKFIISLTLTSGLSAIYNNGSQNIPFLPLLMSAAGSAVLMQLTGVKKADEKADSIRLMNETGKILSCIVFPIFFFFAVSRYELMGLLGGGSGKYIPAAPIFLLSILAVPLRAYSFTTVLQKFHKGALINIGAVVDLLLACTLIYPLYRWLGLPGVALSFVISTYLQASFYLFYSAKLLGVSVIQLLPFSNWLLKLVGFGVVSWAFHYAIVDKFSGPETLIGCIVLMAALVGLSLAIEMRKGKN